MNILLFYSITYLLVTFLETLNLRAVGFLKVYRKKFIQISNSKISKQLILSKGSIKKIYFFKHRTKFPLLFKGRETFFFFFFPNISLNYFEPLFSYIIHIDQAIFQELKCLLLLCMNKCQYYHLSL